MWWTWVIASAVSDVRGALARDDVSAAQTSCASARTQSAEGLEACSWIARYLLAHERYPEALSAATTVRVEAEALLTKRAVDADTHLPVALGAALEVQAQSLAATGDRQQATALLERALGRYEKTSIATRLQKNLNLLTLEGKAAPALMLTPTLTDTKVVLEKGHPTLLFFWAHWCPDCKQAMSDVAELRRMYPKLLVIAPTQLYGFAAGGNEASAPEELAHMQEVWRTAYAPLSDLAAPTSAANFVRFGASSVPTLVLIDATGKVARYHPGKMDRAALTAAVAKLF